MKFQIRFRAFVTSLLIATIATTIQAETSFIDLQAGTLLPSKKGLYFERETGGSLNLRIEDDQFMLVFLNPHQQISVPANIEEVLLIAESIRGEDDRENYLLTRTGNGPVFTHPRFIKKPYMYRVKVRISSFRKTPTPSTASGVEKKTRTEEYGFTILNQ